MNKLQENLMKAEGVLSGLILKHPEILTEYTINKKLLSDDSLFYIGMVDRLLGKGIEHIDEVTFTTEVDNLGLTTKYNELGGYQTIKELKNIVDVRNAESIIDTWTKWNLVKKYEEKGILNIDLNWNKLLKMNSGQVIDYIEYQINDIDIEVGTDLIVENLNLTNQEIEDAISGANVGLQFSKHNPILNNLMLGLPTSDLTMFASYSGGGKSSYIMNNIVIPIAEQKIKCVIVSNEMKSITYKQLLITYVLTERLDYWKLSRKKFKSGQWTQEDKEMIDKAREIISNEYAPYISFVKMYDYDMSKVSKIAKKEAKKGAKLLIYDTMKLSTSEAEGSYLSLINDSKDLFQICSKLEMAGVVSFQLSPGTKGRVRTIDETCLANAKQVKEVFSEMVGWRDIFSDEYDGETYDIKPYKLVRNSEGKYIKEYHKLDNTKKYKIFFHFKTRNDEVGSAIVMEFLGYQNKWIERYHCTVSDKNRY